MNASEHERTAAGSGERDLARAEQRGADRLRDRIRAAVAEHRRVVRVGEQQVEVVETAAIADVLDD